MPKFQKGSEEAKAWGDKMKKAREAKKSMKGGMIKEDTNNEIKINKMKKIVGKGIPQKRRPIELVGSSQPMTDTQLRQLEMNLVSNRIMSILNSRDNYETQYENINAIRNDTLPFSIQRMSPELQDNYREQINIMVDAAINNLQERHRNEPSKKRRRLKGGYLQPGEIPLALNEYQLLQDKLIEGEGVCSCDKCEMCGGSLSKSLLKVGKSFGKVGETLNPMSYALKNKGTREAMIKSGEITQDYAIPAITTAGLPLYYGAAGTAGMMLGGPLGALAATEAADMLWQEQVAKKGYDPQQRQKSKTLAMVSKEVGKLGASQLKKDLGPSKPSAPPSKGKGLCKKKKVKLILLE